MNISKLLNPALCAIGLLASQPLLAQSVPETGIALPDIGDSSGRVISAEDERRIGEEFLRYMRASHQFVADAEVNEYIQSLGYGLVAHSDNQSQPFSFSVLINPQINAFAAPGGVIGVNSGLILATQSESELASVLAHEVAHITQRHLARAYEARSKLNTRTLAAIIAAVLIGSQDSEAGGAALAAATADSIQEQINFTRANEQEADALGIRSLARAGFDPRGMPEFFARLGHADRYYGRPPEFLSTHPLSDSRIAESRARSESYPYKQIADSEQYHLVRAKLHVLSEGDAEKSVAHFRKVLESKSYHREEAARYGYALALLKANRVEAALTEARNLLAGWPEQLSFVLLTAKAEAAAGSSVASLKRLEAAFKLYPNHPALTRDYAAALLDGGAAKQAVNLIRGYMRERQPDGELYALRARAEYAAGTRADAHRFMAEHHVLNGRIEEAIRLLDEARNSPDANFYQRAQSDARRRELMLIKQAEKNETRKDS